MLRALLMPLELQAHPINPDGTISPQVDSGRPSLPSPVFEGATCCIANVRYDTDGGLIGDVTISATLTSAACDTLEGEDGQIEVAELALNDDPASSRIIDVNPSKEPNGPPGRPYPYERT